MSRRRLLLRLLLKAAWVRKDRALTALISVAVVATIATTALTIYSNLEGTLSREFRSFGANAVVTPASGAVTTEQRNTIASILGNKGESVPVAFVVAHGAGNSRVVVGVADLAALEQLDSWWSLRNTNAANGTALA